MLAKKRLQAVVAFLKDRVELVVVALCAAEGQAEEGGADGVGNVVQDLLAALAQVGGVALIRKVAIEGGGDVRFGVAGPKLVARDLLFDE